MGSTREKKEATNARNNRSPLAHTHIHPQSHKQTPTPARTRTIFPALAHSLGRSLKRNAQNTKANKRNGERKTIRRRDDGRHRNSIGRSSQPLRRRRTGTHTYTHTRTLTFSGMTCTYGPKTCNITKCAAQNVLCILCENSAHFSIRFFLLLLLILFLRFFFLLTFLFVSFLFVHFICASVSFR